MAFGFAQVALNSMGGPDATALIVTIIRSGPYDAHTSVELYVDGRFRFQRGSYVTQPVREGRINADAADAILAQVMALDAGVAPPPQEHGFTIAWQCGDRAWCRCADGEHVIARSLRTIISGFAAEL